MFLKQDDLQVVSDEECSGCVVKTNRLIMAIQRLTLSETRLIQMAIISARESGGLRHKDALYVSASSYAKTFGTSKENAYLALKEAEDRLFNRRFRFIEDGDEVKSQWVTRVKYLTGESALKITLSDDVINEITQIDGFDRFFTSYRIEQTSRLKSIYSIRLYELLVQWMKAGKTPIFQIEIFRSQMGLEGKEYATMSNFKANVLDLAVAEINEKTDIKTSYSQFKKGRVIAGFSFSVTSKKKAKPKRKKISIAEAIQISQTIEGAFAGELEKDAILRVMNHKDDKGNSVYIVDSTTEKWAEFRAKSKAQAQERQKEAESYKWVTIGNTRIDDEFIDKHIKEGENWADARIRIIEEVKKSLAKSLEKDDAHEMNSRNIKLMLSKSDAEKKGKVGESWDDLKERLISEGYVLNF